MEVEEFWEPFETTLDSFDAVVDTINTVMARAVARNIQFAWRGHVNANWALHSSLYRRLILTKGRILPESYLAKEEIKILIDLHRWGVAFLGSYCLDSRIKCNMIEIIRRCLVEKLLRGLKVKTFSWPGVQQPRDVVQADLAHA